MSATATARAPKTRRIKSDDDLSALGLDELRTVVVHALGGFDDARREQLEHALAAGAGLLAARRKLSAKDWRAWCDEIGVLHRRAVEFCGLANHATAIREAGIGDYDTARHFVVRGCCSDEEYAKRRARALRLLNRGKSPAQVAAAVGFQYQHVQGLRSAQYRRSAAQEWARREEERVRVLKANLRGKRSSALHEAYALLRKSLQKLEEAEIGAAPELLTLTAPCWPHLHAAEDHLGVALRYAGTKS